MNPASIARPLRALACAALLTSSPLSAATFVVTSSADTAGSSCGSVCTLRQALTAANATATADTINFDIDVPIRGDILIQPQSNLPAITQPLTINGYSQSGTRVNDSELASNAALRIRIDGAGSAAQHGLAVCASNTTVRGIAVTRFLQHGIIVGDSPCAAGVNAVQLLGNFIGTTGGGGAAAGNTGSGIRVAGSFVSVGSLAIADRNVIAASGSSGIELRGSFSGNSLIHKNLIGTDRSGSQDFGNGVGIRINDSYNNAFINQNLIRFNGIGVHINGGVNNRLVQNRIFDNDGLGIDLGTIGVTANDADDLDNGPNQLQNFPVLTEAHRNPDGFGVLGTLDVGHTTPIDYTLEFFASAACDPSGNGEGERYLGQSVESFRQTTQGFSAGAVTSDPLPPGTVITVTARSANAVGTSEFSACFPLDPPPVVVNSSDDVNDGACDIVHCSLREAINSANAYSGIGLQYINFAIPPLTGTSEILITPASPLPRISRLNILIDGYSQPGSVVNTDPVFSNAVPRIRLNGSAAAPIGFDICGVATVIRGLALTGFEEAISFNRPGCNFATSGSAIGNFFGLRADGSTAAANQRSIVVNGTSSLPVVIGGTAIGDRNVFGGGTVGIQMDAQATAQPSSVLGNLFGTDKSGTQDRAIATALALQGTSNSVVVGSADAPNRFRFNGRAIAVTGSALANRFGDNHFAGSSVLGIDLGADGVTGNDVGDVDSGPNGLINFPLLTLAERNANGVRVVGNVDVPGVPAAGTLTINFYASASCHPSGHGEGHQLLGSSNVGEAFDAIVATDADLVALPFITSTATHLDGTSEFSTCLLATDPPVGIAVDTSSDSLTVDGGCDIVGDGNLCTLREALLLANTQAGADRIRFQIPGGGPHVITPVALLPAIGAGLTIDGYTQAGSSPNAAVNGFDAVLRIELRPAGLAHALRVCTTEPVDIVGLAFTAGTAAAIDLKDNDAGNCALAGNVRVLGNQFGITAAGATSSVFNAVSANGSRLTLGGPGPADRNLVTRADNSAVLIAGPLANGTVVQNNLFGRDGDFSSVPNVEDIRISSASNVSIGGDGLLANDFAGSSVAIVVLGTNADNNTLYGNRFLNHSGATAIDLGSGGNPDGITANDLNDADTGPNDGQNTPVLQSGSIIGGDSISIQGTLDVPTGIVTPVNYRLALYRSTQCNDAAGVGREGQVYLGSVLKSFASDAEAFTVIVTAAPEAGFITATATSPSGSTSEFSNCLTAPRPENLHADGFE